jgi:cobalt-zinc-cadmium efflux system protein
MSHNHNNNQNKYRHHNHSHNQVSSEKRIGVAFVLNLFFCIVEIIGGLYTNSIAIISDAVHDFGDSVSLGLAWVFQRYSKKGRDLKYSYGYRRFSLLGALINSVVLLVGSVFIITECVKRIINPEPTNAEGMLILAIFGIIVNGLAMLNLRKGGSLNERTVSLHLLEDVLGWVAILVGSIIMHFFDLPILDPMLSLGISCYILYNIYHNLKDVFRVILQGTPENINIKEIEKLILGNPKILTYHDLHLWSMDGEYNIMSIHIVISHILGNKDIIKLKFDFKEHLLQHNIQHCTIEIECENDICDVTDTCCE